MSSDTECKPDQVCSETKPSKGRSLHPILIRHNSFEDDIDEFKYRMRPRANTDPVSPRPKFHRLHVTFDLPDIIVDDCSDNDEDNLDSSNPEKLNLANTDQGAFFVFKSPPRQRSNTCPKNMFSASKKKLIRNRPATPPPSEDVVDGFKKYPSWEKVEFSPHHLTRVTEDGQEQTSSTDTVKSQPKETSRSRQKHITNNHSTSKVKSLNTSRQSKSVDSPSSSPKRTPKIPNGHVTAKNTGIRDVIQSSA